MFIRTLLTTLLMLSITASWAQQPRLVVNFIISSLRSGDIEKYSDNSEQSAFKIATEQGLYYKHAEYNFARSTPPSTLATLSSGADPSMHGVVGTTWFDYSSNEQESLIEDAAYRNLPITQESSSYSARNLIAQSISEALLEQSPKSKSATIALTPLEAIVTAGKSENIFWINPSSSLWSTSTAFTKELPEWVESFNSKSQPIFTRAFSSWQILNPNREYLNKRYSDIDISKYKEKKSLHKDNDRALIDLIDSYNRIIYTPLGNTLTLEFAKATMANLDMGRDDSVDILNIHLTASGAITQLYGRESVEVEDMLYHLDEKLLDFINFTKAQIKGGEVIFTLTSDSGGSPSYDIDGNNTSSHKRFNRAQAEVILNGFLAARHGEGNWILGIYNSSIYLNHNTIYQMGLSVADIQNEIATFMMHFDGVAYALTATVLQSSAMGYGYAELIQRSFFARRSGDVILALLPGWIELDGNIRSKSGSIYRYDRDVPLIFYGYGIPAKEVNKRVDMTSFAPTLSTIMGIEAPISNQGEQLEDIQNR